MPDPSEEPDPQFQTTLITSLTVYNISTKKSKSKGAEKIVKVKEIDFTGKVQGYCQETLWFQIYLSTLKGICDLSI